VHHLNSRSASYWTATAITAFVFLTGGGAYLFRADEPLRGMAELGYPAYFVTILGIWKLLGGLAILAPRSPRLKEWAYAGIAFDLTGAAFSHVGTGHSAVKVAVPILLLGIAGASWALRPASRILIADSRCPAVASAGRVYRGRMSSRSTTMEAPPIFG